MTARLSLAALLPLALSAQSAPPEPVRAIVAAFDRVNLVGLGERHASIEDLDFRLRLVRDPEFQRKVNDIVLEFANPVYQTVLDRFVDGDDVSRDELKKVWETTTQNVTGSSPVYEEFIRGVRAVNSKLPPGKRLRIVAGDYPFDKADPASREAIHQGYRDEAPAEIIRREVLDKHRKALVVFGSWHLHRDRGDFLARMEPKGNMVMLLKEDSRATWFLVSPIGGPDLPWPVTTRRGTPQQPAWVAGKTALDMDAAALGWADRPLQFQVRNLVDALLYFGPKKTAVDPGPAASAAFHPQP